MSNVVSIAADNDGQDADAVLDEAKGHFQDVLVIGWNKDGCLQHIASPALTDLDKRVWIIECVKAAALQQAFESD